MLQQARNVKHTRTRTRTHPLIHIHTHAAKEPTQVGGRARMHFQSLFITVTFSFFQLLAAENTTQTRLIRG